MANWSEILNQWNAFSSVDDRHQWVRDQLRLHFGEISSELEGANILFYFSAFLQKPQAPPFHTQMMSEDINGIMNAFYQMDFDKPLAVIINTPGGDISAAETIIEYIHGKFEKVFAIVPVMSMSAGTMFALSCDQIVISKAGQLGPTDPQIVMQQGAFSVKDIIGQFKKARDDILGQPMAANAWAPILSAYGPALYEQAVQVEVYAKTKMQDWLKRKGKSAENAKKIVEFFYDLPNFHGQRIGHEELRQQGINVHLLENKQTLQNAVMKAYHLATVSVENSTIAKMILGYTAGRDIQGWIKNSHAP